MRPKETPYDRRECGEEVINYQETPPDSLSHGEGGAEWIRYRIAGTPVIRYLHENQVT